MGDQPAKLTVLPSRRSYLCNMPLMANISDHVSMINLAPFGRCSSLGFPSTARATAQHMGILTPMPCQHNTPDPWIGGKKDYLAEGQPALLKSSICKCKWGGVISIIDDGQKGESPDIEKQPVQGFDQKIKDDIIVVVDAYWVFFCNGIEFKMKYAPYQHPKILEVEFVYKYDDIFHTKENSTITIKNPDGIAGTEKTIIKAT